MVAAPTTSLPEQIGGERNWDYRYCWLRDATLVLLGAMHAGYFEEAQAWREWLLRAVAGSPGQLQIMYGIAGERRLTEWIAPWLPGYENSAPVRIGNAAHSQLQLDVFGEIMDVHHQARRSGLSTNEVGLGGAARLSRTSAKNLAGARRGHLGSPRRAAAFHPFQGHGLGRVRPRDQERGDFRTGGAAGRVARDRATRFARRCARKGFDQSPAASCNPTARNTSTPACCSYRASASCRCPIRAWRAPSPRSSGDCCATASSCATTPKRPKTACRPAKARFSPAASGWPTSTCLQGRIADAERLFRRLMALRNDVGLLSEEYDPRARAPGRQFPAGLLAHGAGQHRL